VGSATSSIGAGLAAVVLVAGGIATASAQVSRPATGPAGARPAAPARTGECAQLPGGRAPVLKIAGLATGLSPRDLDLVYFGKPLADLTDEDFAQIRDLSRRCGQGEGILPADKLESFETIVRDAQKIRHVTLDRIKRQMSDIATLPAARDKLVRLNGLSENLPTLEPAMTRGDLKNTAAWIAREMQSVYDVAAKGRVEASAAAPPAPAARPATTAPPAEDAPRAGRIRRPGGEEE
jgi:hypothetical protein